MFKLTNVIRKKYQLTLLIAMLLIFSFAACKKNETPTPVNNNTAVAPLLSPLLYNINSTPQTLYTIDGVKKHHVSNGASGSGSSSSVDEFYADFQYSSDIDNGHDPYYLGITLGTLTISDSRYPTDVTFKNFFHSGSRPYSIDAENGVEISINDENGVYWSTSLGTGNQTGSSFIIDEVKEADAINGYYVTVKASFSCKLYDEEGNTKVLTDGIYIGDFGNF